MTQVQNLPKCNMLILLSPLACELALQNKTGHLHSQLHEFISCRITF